VVENDREIYAYWTKIYIYILFIYLFYIFIYLLQLGCYPVTVVKPGGSGRPSKRRKKDFEGSASIETTNASRQEKQ